ncbi:hypothetical protein EDD11_001796 [Mortierella claussenii]|nr:hypothetical protein EDD11_001796 [Mortierella claussenii]
MGSDLRASSRDLLTLAQKVSTVLQRHSESLREEIEGVQEPFSPEEKASRSEQCQRAIELRRHVEETSELLKSALEHVEDIEDEDEPRILREPMDVLQIYIRDALKTASPATSQPESLGTSGQLNPPIDNPAPSKLLETDAPSTVPAPAPMTLLSSPAQEDSIKVVSTKSSTTAPSITSTVVSTGPLGHLGPLEPTASIVVSPRPRKAATPIVSVPYTSNSTLIAISEAPLSISVAPSTPKKTLTTDVYLVTTPSSSSASSLATFASALTSPPETPIYPPDNVGVKNTDQPVSLLQRRRVPRGLFSSSSIERSEPVKTPIFDSSISATTGDTGTQGSAKMLTLSHQSDESGTDRPAAKEPHMSGAISSSQSSVSQPQSPRSPPDSTFSTPSTPGPKSPTTSHFQRSQPKPSPIQTTSISGTPRSIGKTKDQNSYENEEEISQLAKDLERAMNPTPTDPVPQPYFLQGKGLLQRIPSQVSMDDGLLNEDQDRHQSEDFSEPDVQAESSGLSRGNGSLRRQRSGGKRRFRIARSRSRNRSRGRQENRKAALTPIEVGYPSVLTSSEWPFNQTSNDGHDSGSVGASSQLPPRDQFLTRSRMQPWFPRAGPHLPFAESVTIGNPIRVGKGIASFTIYSITLKLCDPARAVVQPPPSSSRIRSHNEHHQQDDQIRLGLHARHASEESAAMRPHSIQATEQGDEGGVAQGRFAISKAPSKASLMMTRSLSFPELSGPAERLLMGLQPPDEIPPSPLRREPGESSSSRDASFSTATCVEESSDSSIAAPSSEHAPGPGRIVHVQKRYTDFVTLRAQLVEALRNGNERGRPLFSRSSVGRHTAAASSGSSSSATSSYSIINRLHFPEGNQGHGDPEDDDDDDDDDEGVSTSSGLHSRQASTASTASLSSVSCNSLIRGMPKLPPKKMVGKFRPAFVEKRRRELEYFLEWVIAHPIIGDCPVVVQWFLGPSSL